MRILLPILFLFFSTTFYNVQDSLQVNQDRVRYDLEETLAPVEFNEAKIEDLKEDKDFQYLAEIENDSWWTRLKRWIKMRYDQLVNWIFGDYQANSVIAFLLLVLPYLIIGAVIGFIFWLFIRLNPGASILADPARPEVYYNEEEKLVHSQDISELINEAINNGDYRLAVRYYYLQLLKQLNEKGLIQYEYQKTNLEYLNEVPGENYKKLLKSIMRIYDFIWYGNFPVTREDFTRAQRYFQEMESSLKGVPNE